MFKAGNIVWLLYPTTEYQSEFTGQWLIVDYVGFDAWVACFTFDALLVFVQLEQLQRV